MKKLHLLYNPRTEEYYFSDAFNPYINEGRKVLEEEGIVKYLKSEVNVKRKSILTLLNVNEEMEKRIKNVLKDSKVVIEIKSDKI